MKRQAEMMERQIGVAEQNVTAAQVAADAAKTSAKIVMDTQRASIHIVSMGLRRGSAPLADNAPATDDSHVAVIFKNHGPTRAISISVNGTLSIAQSNKSTVIA